MITFSGYVIALIVLLWWQLDKYSYKAKWVAFLKAKHLQEKQIIDSLKAVCDTYSHKPAKNTIKFTQLIGSNRYN